MVITIRNHAKAGYKNVGSSLPWFKGKEEVVFEDYSNDGFIAFREPDIDYSGKTFKPHNPRSTWHSMTLPIDIEEGQYLLDEEESDDSKIVFYLEDRLKEY